MSRRRRSRRGLLGWAWRLGVIALLWLLGVAGWIVWVGDRDQAAPADAIIVLGAAAYDAKPSPVFEERIRHGLDLYRRGYAPVLIFTGGYGGAGARFAESQVARRYALRQQVPEEAILIETESRTTRQNLEQARALMRQHDLHRVIVVSDPLHMARALRLAEKGYRVAVLEQGREHSAADLRRAGQAMRHLLWAPALGLRGPLAQKVYRNVGVVHGVGVGGGSLVYAAVLLEPQAAFYRDPAWAALDDWQASLAAHYQRSKTGPDKTKNGSGNPR